jgi:hypothetical protein
VVYSDVHCAMESIADHTAILVGVMDDGRAGYK